MRISVKTLSMAMVLAVVISVAISQAAWSATLGTPYELEGTVYQCEPGSSGIQIDTGAGIVTVYGMGPASYWGDVAFPQVGDTITILVGEITYSDGTSKLVAIKVDVDNDGDYEITLRDSTTGVPLWRGSKAALTQSRGIR